MYTAAGFTAHGKPILMQWFYEKAGRWPFYKTGSECIEIWIDTHTIIISKKGYIKINARLQND